MTNEEALNWFKDDLKNGKCSDECPQCNAVEKAIEALEKQIPKKCRIKRTAKLQTFYCPTCEQVVVSRIENEWLAWRLQKYCDSCGQALDWSDTE